MITVHGFPGTDDLASLSPFCEKVVVWLRMAQLDFRYAAGDPRKSPKGKVPYVTDADGLSMGDSQHIVEHLAKRHGVELDAGLSAAQHARAHLVRRTLEEGLYFVLLTLRWSDDEGWQHLAPHIKAMLPPMARGVLPGLIRRGVRKQAHAQGAGRHSRDELLAMARADLEALSAELGDKPYFLDERPRSIDATAYATLGNLVYGPRSAVSGLVEAHDNLAGYVRRVREQFGGPAR